MSADHICPTFPAFSCTCSTCSTDLIMDSAVLHTAYNTSSTNMTPCSTRMLDVLTALTMCAVVPQGLRYSVWPADGPMFPKLRLKYKPNLISLAGGISGWKVTDPEARATPLEPSQWREMIAEAQVRDISQGERT